MKIYVGSSNTLITKTEYRAFMKLYLVNTRFDISEIITKNIMSWRKSVKVESMHINDYLPGII